MYFFEPSEQPSRELVPGIVARLFWGERMMLAVVEIDPGALLPEHNHPHEQAGMILEGELELTIGGESRLLTAGHAYIIPGGTLHSARAGDAPCRVLDIFSPVREEYKY
jgi:quercetin dioxygenase-like cupin family protein